MTAVVEGLFQGAFQPQFLFHDKSSTERVMN
jgi:hypothetical protein